MGVFKNKKKAFTQDFQNLGNNIKEKY